MSLTTWIGQPHLAGTPHLQILRNNLSAVPALGKRALASSPLRHPPSYIAAPRSPEIQHEPGSSCENPGGQRAERALPLAPHVTLGRSMPP